MPFKKVSVPQTGDIVIFTGHMGIFTNTQGNKGNVWNAQSGANQFKLGMDSWFSGTPQYYRYNM